ncbi:MAG TPA: DUF4892 domain-containing protein [Polyangiaceae bacterium]|nr:DUF4892 domain-containing protein [Polyangiaceae bacterium]
MKTALVSLQLTLLPAAALAAAPPPLPTADVAGSADSPVLKRYDGSIVLSYEKRHFDSATFPLSKLEFVAGKRDNHNNEVAEPKQKKTAEGEITHLVYVMPEQRSALEVARYFQDAVKAKKGKLLYECKAPDCGGNETGNSVGGGGRMSLPMYIRHDDQITDPGWSLPWCTAFVKLTELRYFVAELPALGAVVSVQVAMMPDANGACSALHGRALAVVDVVQGKAQASSPAPSAPSAPLARTLAAEGKATLSGLDFQPNSAALPAEARSALTPVAELLNASPGLRLLVVDHTDNEGGYQRNADLSKKRADAIVKTLVDQFKIKRERLTAVGAGSAAPLTTNKSSEGRAKNRRVELVEN